ncbi:RNA polymerase sigma factor [Actinorugispora endophytica]|uniref:RNA polymerase sigma-70 factor (ECF subfamily) n=1 Tax=Actinorugispora endophytica TaxID=1605990 RepID=A0A4V3D8S9_9ACTN|nr:sigma-70 family RNA polymerase sigma factor [Actinorugispora endophytica]TDQ52981.1 RNA polymerase sigma-70 factor (ECF subfamily) [Actinorugispora endophytica]
MESPADRLTALYDQFHRRVLGYALLRAEPEVAEEVASETFVVAWQRLDTVPRSPLPWLLGVARNLLHKHYDAQRRQRLLVERVTALSSEDDVLEWDVAEHVVGRQSALEALGALPERYAEALTLVTWNGLSAAEAARTVGCSTPAFTVRLHRARRALRRLLRQEHGHAARDGLVRASGRRPQPAPATQEAR